MPMWHVFILNKYLFGTLKITHMKSGDKLLCKTGLVCWLTKGNLYTISEVGKKQLL